METLPGVAIADVRMTAITFGTFDLTHPGHYRFFRRMKALADRVTVMVQRRERVAATKPSGLPPVLTDAERLFNVRSCRYVDEARLYRAFSSRTLSRLDFDILCIGPEHAADPRFAPCLAWCRRHGRRVAVIPRTAGVSTSEIRRRIAG